MLRMPNLEGIRLETIISHKPKDRSHHIVYISEQVRVMDQCKVEWTSYIVEVLVKNRIVYQPMIKSISIIKNHLTILKNCVMGPSETNYSVSRQC